MHAEDTDLLEKLIACIERGERCSLVTVLQTYGSSPRPVGSLLMISESGQFAGSVSGGCIEELLIEELIQQPIHHIEQRVFGVDDDDKARLKLPCGGVVKMLIEPIKSTHQSQFSQLLNAIQSRQYLYRIVNFQTGESVIKADSEMSSELQYNETTMTRRYGAAWRLVIIGAVHLSESLAELSTMLGFDVTVCDPREEYCNNISSKFCTIIQAMPEEYLQTLSLDEQTALVSVAHDAKIDEFALIYGLKSSAFYVGALGSRRTAAQRLDRMRNEWKIDDKTLQKIHGPVGLNIGSQAPMEIALSIIAEIVSVRNKLN